MRLDELEPVVHRIQYLDWDFRVTHGDGGPALVIEWGDDGTVGTMILSINELINLPQMSRSGFVWWVFHHVSEIEKERQREAFLYNGKSIDKMGNT